METPPECSPGEGHGSEPPGLSCLIRAVDKPEAWKRSPAKVKDVLYWMEGLAQLQGLGGCPGDQQFSNAQ